MFRLHLLSFCFLACIPSLLQAADAPNVLIIMADDCTYSDLPAYGGKNAQTPHIDQLARQGLTFERAYLSEAMCQPCRSELFSGLFPMRNGCAWNHSASRPNLQTMPQRLRKAGYRVGLAGKVHVKPKSSFPFDSVAGFDPNCVRNPTRPCDLNATEAYMQGPADEPFCLVVALVEPHVPWVMGDASQYPVDKIQLPPNIADTAITREAFGRYLAEITYMDAQVGDLLGALERSGKADDTLVLFTSEQGAQFPGCKWTNWDTGLHSALVARWPGVVPADERTEAIVQYADVLPTLLDLADTGAEEGSLDGQSFASVLRGEASDHRSYAFGLHNNIPEGPAYPSRTISDGEYRLIRNLTPQEIYIEKHLMGWTGTGQLNNPYWATWVREASNDAKTYDLVKRYMHRPAAELYHTAQDPYEMNDLSDDPAHAEVRARLEAELDRWLGAQQDPGIPQDTQQAIQAARQGKHLYGAPAPQQP